MYKDLGKNRLGFKIGDIIKFECSYGTEFIHIDKITESGGLTYYYDYSKHLFVNEPIDDNDTNLELVDDNDETYKRYKLYLELEKEFYRLKDNITYDTRTKA